MVVVVGEQKIRLKRDWADKDWNVLFFFDSWPADTGTSVYLYYLLITCMYTNFMYCSWFPVFVCYVASCLHAGGGCSQLRSNLALSNEAYDSGKKKKKHPAEYSCPNSFLTFGLVAMDGDRSTTEANKIAVPSCMIWERFWYVAVHMVWTFSARK